MATTIEKREARLLRWETYLRRTRHVAFSLGILGIVMPIVLSAWGALPTDDASEPTVWIAIFFLVWAYEAHLKVRHIESIKFHRESHAAANQRLQLPRDARDGE